MANRIVLQVTIFIARTFFSAQYIFIVCIQLLPDIIVYSREPLVVSGTAIPPPELPLPLKCVKWFSKSVSNFSSEEMLDGETEVKEVVLVKVEVSPPVTNAELSGAGAYGEPYAPLPGRDNRSCICAV